MNQTQRILTILHQLSLSKKICVKVFAQKFGVDTRTMQRDFKILRDFLKEKLQKVDRDCYVLFDSSELIDKIFQQDGKKIFELFEFLAIFGGSLIELFESLDKSFFAKIKKSTDEIYYIHENPIETLKNTTILDKLKEAIYHKKYINMKYFETKMLDFKQVKPLKIILSNGNWYLATKSNYYKMNNGFKLFRINFIRELVLDKKTFKTDKEALEHIHNLQSLFHNYKCKRFEVVLKVDSSVKRHFEVKKYLNSQQNLPQDDGSLILRFQITNEMEIVPLVKKWLPHIKVLSPVSLRERIAKDIKSFLNDI